MSDKQTAKINRYFLFTFTWQSPTQYGDGNLWMERPRFPSNIYLKKMAAEGKPADAQIAITGWNEFRDEDDYLAFIDTAEAAHGTS